MAAHKVDGFNSKEQKVFNKLLDGEPHDIREMKRMFWRDAEAHCGETYEAGWGEKEIDAQAQSYVRNSIRRLIRDGWVEQTARGTYRLSRTGKDRVKKGTSVTKSKTESQRGKGKRKAKTKAKAKIKETKTKPKAKAKKAKPETKAKAKKTKSEAKAKKAKGNGSSKPKVSTDKLKEMKKKSKIAAAKERFANAPAE